jgi:hypothetical protein
MVTRVDGKGKVFTERIRKKPLPVRIYTESERIDGYIHTLPDHRLKDELNSGEPFMAITDAQVFSRSDGSLIEISDFLVVNSSKVVLAKVRDDE